MTEAVYGSAYSVKMTAQSAHYPQDPVPQAMHKDKSIKPSYNVGSMFVLIIVIVLCLLLTVVSIHVCINILLLRKEVIQLTVYNNDNQ